MTDDAIIEAAADYRTLADHIITTLNPPASDGDEVSRCMDAVMVIATYVHGQPCVCVGDHAVCDRCWVLGQHYGGPVQR